MTYDFILMNPPYDKNLHLKIVEQSIPMLTDDGILVNLSPIRWLQSLTSKDKDGDFLNNHLMSLHIVNQKDAQDMFNARIFMDLAVYVITKSDSGKKLTDFNKFELLGYGDTASIAQSIWDKVQDFAKKDSFKDHLNVVKGNEDDDMKGYTVVFSHMSGLMDCHNFVYHNGVAPDGRTYKQHVRNQHKNAQTDHFQFDNFEEADNLRGFIKTPFMEWVKKCLGINGWLIMWAFPYFGNVMNKRTGKVGYKSDWTNDDILEVLQIDKNDWERVNAACWVNVFHE